MVIFKDSTMEEIMYDIILLLSGMSKIKTGMDPFMMGGVL